MAGGISVGVLYCFGGGATRRVVIQVIIKGFSFAVFPHAKIPRGFAARFAWRLRHQKSSQGTIIPPATLAKSVLEVFSKASCNSDQFPSPVLVWQIVIYFSVYLFSGVSFFLFLFFIAPLAPYVGRITDISASKSSAVIQLWPAEQRNGPIRYDQSIVPLKRMPDIRS